MKKLAQFLIYSLIFLGLQGNKVLTSPQIKPFELEKVKEQLERVMIPVSARAIRPGCRVGHPDWDNLVAHNELGSLYKLEMFVSDDRFVSRIYQDNIKYLLPGIDPLYPEPLEIQRCSLYEMVRRYVDGENVRVLFEDNTIKPISQFPVFFYRINNQKEIYQDPNGNLWQPFYPNNHIPKHLRNRQNNLDDPLEARKFMKKMNYTQYSITLQQLIRIMANQKLNTQPKPVLWLTDDTQNIQNYTPYYKNRWMNKN